MFFVISRYLTTSILLREIDEGHLSIARFYKQRARRILPSLFVVTVTCNLISWWRLLPNEYRTIGWTTLSVSMFVSNIHSWNCGGCFDQAAGFKPLLHTWSLGVEEQYSLLFPIALLLFRRRAGASLIVW